jgi:uncharacterized protein (DUF736 family)
MVVRAGNNTFFPRRVAAPRATKKDAFGLLRPSRLRPWTGRIEAPLWRSQNSKEDIMIIGKFTTTKTGGYSGYLITLTHRGKLTFTPADKGVDYQVSLDGIDVGAAWERTAKESGKAYLSVKLDSPFLPRPVNCALMAQDDGSHILVWSRDERKQA